jgi:hypothetical protein
MEEIIFIKNTREDEVNFIRERRLKTEKQCNYIKGILAESANPS